MAKKTMNNVRVYGENVKVEYEGAFGRILREINSMSHGFAPIFIGGVFAIGILLSLMKINYIVHLLGGMFVVFILYYIHEIYIPKKGFLTIVGIFKNKKKGKPMKYFLHLGDAVRAINEIPDPSKVKKFFPEKLEYPILIDYDMALRHMFAVGTTGSGKTTFSIYLLKQHLGIGGGAMIVDGKGDKDIYTDIVNTCIHHNREDDVFVINFNAPKESNRMNPLLKGDTDDMADLLGNLLESGGDNAIWAGRALSMMNGVMSCLIPLRDHNELYDPLKLKNDANQNKKYQAFEYDLPKDIDPNDPKDGSGIYQPILTFKVLNKFLELETLRDLYFRMVARNEAIERGDERFKNRGDIKVVELDRMAAYLASCSTSVRRSAHSDKIEEGGNKMHSNSNVMWGEGLDLFQGTYGDIFNTDTPNIVIQDIVYNSRFLYILLPATKKNPRTLSMLGKIILALLKQAVASLLGDKISGDLEERRASSAIRPIIPFLAIMDEYGAYAVQGFDNVLAQARSLRVSVIIEVQEIASLEKGGEIDKKRLLGNTAIKVILKVEDLSTAEELAKMIGTEQKAYVRQSTEGDSRKTFDVQERNIIEAKQLAEMGGGHGYVRFSGDTTPMLAGYYKPPNARYIEEFNVFDTLTTQEYSYINYLDSISIEGGETALLNQYDAFKEDSPLSKKLNGIELSVKPEIGAILEELNKTTVKLDKVVKSLKYDKREVAKMLLDNSSKLKSGFKDFIAKSTEASA